MKIIFSRKGFDDTNGHCRNPIFEDKTYFSLPIPYDEGIPFANVNYMCNGNKSINLLDLLNDLGDFKTKDKDKKIDKVIKNCHYDPDITDNVTIKGRSKPWQRGFGQKGSSQGHLKNCKVGEKDIFIFFGTFQEVTEQQGKYKYKEESKERHVIFGWLQVGEILEINPNQNNKSDKSEYLLLENHPHYNWDSHVNNVIYLPTEKLSLNSKRKGCGTFDKYDEKKFLLTQVENNENKSLWKLPNCFHKDNGVTLSCHGKDLRWGKEKGGFFDLQTVGMGQEFVLNYDNAEQETKVAIENWVKNLFA